MTSGNVNLSSNIGEVKLVLDDIENRKKTLLNKRRELMKNLEEIDKAAYYAG